MITKAWLEDKAKAAVDGVENAEFRDKMTSTLVEFGKVAVIGAIRDSGAYGSEMEKYTAIAQQMDALGEHEMAQAMFAAVALGESLKPVEAADTTLNTAKGGMKL